MIQSDGAVAVAAILSSLVYVNLWVQLSYSGFISSKLTRKIVHVTGGPIYLTFWPLFSSSVVAPVWCSLIPIVQAAHLILSGLETKKWDGKAKKVRKSLALAVSRDGDAKEALHGPLIYNAVLILTTWFGWRYNLASIVSICQLSAGDGFADIIGRRWGNSKWFFSNTKTYIGSVGFVLAAWLISILYVEWFHMHGYLAISASEAATKLLIVSLGCAIVEVAAPVLFGMDDNILVPVTAILLVRSLFGS
eukprot:527332_1